MAKAVIFGTFTALGGGRTAGWVLTSIVLAVYIPYEIRSYINIWVIGRSQGTDPESGDNASHRRQNNVGPGLPLARRDSASRAVSLNTEMDGNSHPREGTDMASNVPSEEESGDDDDDQVFIQVGHSLRSNLSLLRSNCSVLS